MSIRRHFSKKLNKYTRCSAASIESCHFRNSSHIPESVYKNFDETGGHPREKNLNNSIKIESNLEHPYDIKPYDIKIGPEGLSGCYCWGCKRYLTPEFVEDLAGRASNDPKECEYCGDELLTTEGIGVDLNHTERSLLIDEMVRLKSWYHITTNPNWLNSTLETGEVRPQSQILVHIGSKEAAMDRLRHLAFWNKTGRTQEYYLIELKLDPTSHISPSIMNDENEECPSTVGDAKVTHNYSSEGVSRYINNYEAPGTISLVANPNKLIQKSSHMIEL